MYITRLLAEKDPTLQIHNEGEWSNTISIYSAFNDAGIENQVGTYLFGMVSILQPDHVLETGSHVAIGASYLGLALRDNEHGHLDTIEFLPEIYAQAVKRIKTMELEEYVTCHLCDARNFEPEHNYQLVLLDTEPQTRFAELLKFYPYVDEGGFIFIHDTPRSLCQGNINPDHPSEPSWPFGNIPEEMKQLVRDDKLRPFNFGTPRGLTGLYKVHGGDYKWQK